MTIVCAVLPLCGFVMGMSIPNDIATVAVIDELLAASGQLLPGDTGTGAIPSEGRDDEALKSPAALTASTIFRIPYHRYCGVDDSVLEHRIYRGDGTGSAAASPTASTIFESHFSWGRGATMFVEQYLPNAAASFDRIVHAFEAYTKECSEADVDLLRASQSSVESGRVGGGEPSRAFSRCFSAGALDGAEPVPAAVCWRGLRLYIMNLLGVVAEDFDYAHINRILNRVAKSFAQRTVRNPERLVLADSVLRATPTTPLTTDEGTRHLSGQQAPRRGWTAQSLREQKVTLLFAVGAMLAREEALLTCVFYAAWCALRDL
jgi:hypothetical protein